MTIGLIRVGAKAHAGCLDVIACVKRSVLIVATAGLSGCYVYVPRNLPEGDSLAAVRMDRAQVTIADGRQLFMTAVTIKHDSITGVMTDSVVAIDRAEVRRISEYRLSVAATSIFVAIIGAALLAWSVASAYREALK